MLGEPTDLDILDSRHDRPLAIQVALEDSIMGQSQPIQSGSSQQVIDKDYEAVIRTPPSVGTQYVDPSIVGTTLPTYVQSQVTATGLVMAPEAGMPETTFGASHALTYNPNIPSEDVSQYIASQNVLPTQANSGVSAETGAVETEASAPEGQSGLEKFVSENGKMILAVAGILAVGFFSARGRA